MRSLVTGGAGFLGSHLARRLLEYGHVAVVDNLTGGFEENIPAGVTPYLGDVNDLDLDWLFDRFAPTHIFHLAAYAAEGLSHWVREYNVVNNWLASTRLINMAVKYGVERFTFTSSVAVYGSQPTPFTETLTPRPEDPYAIAKYAVEQDLKAAHDLFGLPYVIFRPHNVYGPGQNIGDPYRNVAGIFMRQASAGDPLTIFGDGTQTRAFTYISDVIDPIVASLTRPVEGETFNIGGEQVITVSRLAGMISDLYGGTPVNHLPERHEVKHAWCDHTKARHHLGFNPKVDYPTGLAAMKAWVDKTGVKRSVTPAVELDVDFPAFWKQYARPRSG